MLYKEARTSLYDREAMIDRAILTLEVEMDYLGTTGVEDKL